MSKTLSGFKDYLITQGYKEFTPKNLPSTVYDYIGRIQKVLVWEGITLTELNNTIDAICKKYDIGGTKENYGNLSHRSVINALKRYSDYCKI